MVLSSRSRNEHPDADSGATSRDVYRKLCTGLEVPSVIITAIDARSTARKQGQIGEARARTAHEREARRPGAAPERRGTDEVRIQRRGLTDDESSARADHAV
jgi:hypothetical protein